MDQLSSLVIMSRSGSSHALKRFSGLTKELNAGFYKLLRKLLHNLLQELLPSGDHIEEKALPLRGEEHLFLSARMGVFNHLDETQWRARHAAYRFGDR